jgi:phage gp36-like protein
VYVTQARIQSRIPGPLLNDALDDNRDGAADDGILDEIIQAASDAVDALVSPAYTVPFTSPPAPVKEAAFAFACEMIYDRRQVSERNPYRAEADKWRGRLELVGAGKLALVVTGNQDQDINIGLVERDRPNSSDNADGL